MACGSCGGRKATTEYLVTLRDGSTERVATVGEARLKIKLDSTESPDGRVKAGTIRAVPKAKN